LIDEKTKVLMRYSHCQQQKEKYVTLKEVDSNGQSLKVLLAYELTGGGLPQDEAQTAFLKHLIQRTDVKERKLYSTSFEQRLRHRRADHGHDGPVGSHQRPPASWRQSATRHLGANEARD